MADEVLVKLADGTFVRKPLSEVLAESRAIPKPPLPLPPSAQGTDVAEALIEAPPMRAPDAGVAPIAKTVFRAPAPLHDAGLDAVAENIATQCPLPSSDPSRARRLRSYITLYLSGRATQRELDEFLVRSPNIGGLGLESDAAQTCVSAIVRGATSGSFAVSPGRQSARSAQGKVRIEQEQERPSQRRAVVPSSPWLPAVLPPPERLRIASAPTPSSATPWIPKSAPTPASPPASTPAPTRVSEQRTAPAILPQRPPPAPKGPVTPFSQVTSYQLPVSGATEKPRVVDIRPPSPRQPVGRVTPLNPQSAALPSTDTPLQNESLQHASRSWWGMPRKSAPLAGPAEELCITLVDFRRLRESVKERMPLLEEKIRRLEKEGYALKLAAVEQWKRSEVFTLYLESARESLKRARSVPETLNQLAAEGRVALTQEEFSAVSQFNEWLGL